MTHLFARIEAQEQLLEDLAFRLVKQASLLELHAWYQSSGGIDEPNLKAASELAAEAAKLLKGETP